MEIGCIEYKRDIYVPPTGAPTYQFRDAHYALNYLTSNDRLRSLQISLLRHYNKAEYTRLKSENIDVVRAAHDTFYSECYLIIGVEYAGIFGGLLRCNPSPRRYIEEE